ncbi:hypothetical protein KL923_002167 [Ogataea haglerorum]|nr:hypothetical protein KL923_002167 [Ogataea haglerorum]
MAAQSPLAPRDQATARAQPQPRARAIFHQHHLQGELEDPVPGQAGDVCQGDPRAPDQVVPRAEGADVESHRARARVRQNVHARQIRRRAAEMGHGLAETARVAEQGRAASGGRPFCGRLRKQGLFQSAAVGLQRLPGEDGGEPRAGRTVERRLRGGGTRKARPPAVSRRRRAARALQAAVRSVWKTGRHQLAAKPRRTAQLHARLARKVPRHKVPGLLPDPADFRRGHQRPQRASRQRTRPGGAHHPDEFPSQYPHRRAGKTVRHRRLVPLHDQRQAVGRDVQMPALLDPQHRLRDRQAACQTARVAHAGVVPSRRSGRAQPGLLRHQRRAGRARLQRQRRRPRPAARAPPQPVRRAGLVLCTPVHQQRQEISVAKLVNSF